MSSPFSFFRKYEKFLIAFFGVGLMIAFLVEGSLLDMLSGNSSGSRGGRSQAPVQFKGGSFTDEQLMLMARADALVDALIFRVREAAEKNNGKTTQFPEDPRFAEPRSEARLVRNHLLAQKAHDLGLTMSNEDADDLLINMAGDAITKEELRKIRREVLAENRSSTIAIAEKDLYAQLRTNLLAQELVAMLRNSTDSMRLEQMGFTSPKSMTLPPAEAWDMFRRTARQVKVELLPLEVEKFVAEVKDVPTAKEKEELFTKYKDIPPAPFSPEPGFAKPHKISFGYVRIDFKPFLDKAKSEVTEDAIREEYDERVKKGELTVPVEKKPEDSKPEDGKPDEPKPDEPKPDESKPDEPKPDEPKPDEPKPDEPKPDEEQSSPDDELDSEADEPETTTDKEEETPAKEETPAAEKPAAETKPDEPKSDEAKPDDEKQPAAESKPEEKKEETRIKTYEEMEEEIRTQLAQKPAQDAQREAIDQLFKGIEEFRNKYREWELDKQVAEEDKSKAKEASGPPPNLLEAIGGLLKKYDFKLQQTPTLDPYEILDEEIGKTSISIPNQQPIALQTVYNFTDVKLYEAFLASEAFLRDTSYIVWKEVDQPQQPAERKEAEEQIVHAFKMQKAFELAKAEAERLKTQATGKEGLRQALGPVDKAGAVIEVGPFSWLSSGPAMGMGMRLRVTEIPEVPYAGEEFMQPIMDLQPGEVGVAADQPHKHVYVVRVISQTPDEEVLREMFMMRGLADQNISQQYSAKRSTLLASWLENVLDKEMQLQWNRPPQQFGR